MLLRGICYRAGRSAVVALLAAVAVAAAVLAPGFSRAAQQSVLTDGLAAAPAAATGLTATVTGTAEAAPAAHRPTSAHRQDVDAALAGHPGLAGVLAPPVAGVDTEAVVTGGREPVAARFAYRDAVCERLRVAGDCPTGPGQVLVSDRTADDYRIRPGDPLTVRLGQTRREVTVVGTYTPADPAAAYWGRTVYFTHGGFDPASGAPRVDAVFTGAEADVRADPAAPVTLALTYPLRPGTVRLDGVAALRADLRALARIGELEVTTALPAVLDEVAGEADALGRRVPVVGVPLLLLAWFVLFLLVAAVVEERGPEVALAKLRGFPGGRAARFGLGEALLLIVAAAPVGFALGLGAVALAARVALAGGVPVELRWPVFAAAAFAVAGAVLAALWAGRATLRRGVLELLRRVPERARWRAGAAEGVVVALAAASLVVALGDPTAPLGLLAPALLAVVAGVVTARLVRLWARLRLRRGHRRGRLSGRLPGLLAAAQLARRPAGARVVAVVTVAVGLLGFATVAWDVAAQARRDHATDALGADRVYTVHADHPAALRDAVHAADPDGTAMAVVRTRQQYAGGQVALLAVDAPRLPEVVRWRGHPGTGRAGLADLAGALRPREPAPLPIAGRIDATVAVRALGAEPVRLAALVSAPGEPPRAVSLGTLALDTRRYAAPLPGCGPAAGCRLLGLVLGRTGVTGPVTATIEVVALRSGDPAGGSGDDDSDAALAARFDHPDAWHAPSEVTLTRGAGLTVAAEGTTGGDVVVEYRDTPPALPAVLAGRAPAEDPAAAEFRFPGLAEQPEPFTVVDRAARLPRAGERGLLVDLEYAVHAAERSVALADSSGLRYEVWASPAAPADLPQRLAGHGVAVRDTESMAGTLDRLGRRAPALGLWLYLLAAAAAVALALGVVALAARIGAAPRRYDLAALRTTGVGAGLLRRAAAREYAILLGAPLLVGLAVGVATAALMLPGIPLVEAAEVGSGGAAGGVPGYRPWRGALPVAVAVTAVGLVLAALPAWRLPRRATAGWLREGAW